MTEGMAGHPYGGREKPPDDAGIPGERPLPESEQEREAPANRDKEDETASRAPEEGAMSTESTEERGLAEPTPGIPEPVDAPSPADATEGDPPGGSAANQRGNVPDE